MSFAHYLYPIYQNDDGVVYQCGTCERKVVYLDEGIKVVLRAGTECTHELIEPIEKVELPVEFEELFTSKGWS